MTASFFKKFTAVTLALWVTMVASPALAQKQGPDDLLDKIGIEQKLKAELPLDAVFTNDKGEEVKLGELFQGRPVILAIVYFECPMLCTMILNGMLRMLKVLKFDVGREFDIVTVSIDHRETPALAHEKKTQYLKRYQREGADQGWHFLVGAQDQIKRLSDTVGYKYAYDKETDQYAHGSAIMVVTPKGKLSKYFYGIEYSPRDVRLAIVEAADEKIGSLVDEVLLYCFKYNPQEGKYSVVVMNVMRLAGGITILGILGFIFFNLLRDRRGRRKEST